MKLRVFMCERVFFLLVCTPSAVIPVAYFSCTVWVCVSKSVCLYALRDLRHLVIVMN